ncbi:RHS repeat-associated core domain-containing protein [Pseudomonas sp. LB3P31]
MTQLKPLDKKTSTWQRTTLLATDNSHSVIGEILDGKHNPIAYTAYGEQSAPQKDKARLGFNGQLREAKIGWYLLGNGYRAYNPQIMRFHSPDSWSPFGGGGLNAYMYCIGDPVNRSDPTGHWVFPTLGGISSLFGGTGAGLNFGAMAVTGPRPANALGILLGYTGWATGLATLGNYAPQTTALLAATSVISSAASNYLGITRSGMFRHAGWYEGPIIRPRSHPPAYSDLPDLPQISRTLPSSPPVYPINSETMMPTSAGHRTPAYSEHHPDLFLSPLPEGGNLSTFSQQIQINGTSALSDANRARRRSLDRMDGLTISTAIRRR